MKLANLNKKLERIDRSSHRVKRRPNRRRLWYTLGILLILAIAIYIPTRGIYSSMRELIAQARAVNTAVKNENLDQIKASIGEMQGSVNKLDNSLNGLFWVRIIPYVGGFYSDAKHFAGAAKHELVAASRIVDSLDPYKEELGFTGNPTPGQDRVVQAVKVLEKVVPHLGDIEPELKSASDEVSKINVGKYPESIGGRPLRSRVELAVNFITGAYTAVSQAKPAIEAAPTALGVPSAKNYLIVFQNDKELRATGGFMTAYAFLRLDQGRVSSSGSDDIYRLDEKLLDICKNVICPLTPPAAIVKYLPEADGKPRTAWSMRDSNFSPDVPTSMADFEKLYDFLDGEQFDGIILIDTNVVEELIKITGPIEVFNTKYSAEIDARCNCPGVIYELERYAQIIEAGEADRKAILGTLMQQLLARSLGASSEKLPEFINAGVKLANDKHVIFYMKDQKLQSALGQLNWTGQVKATEGDYLFVNDSNFAGGKSNMYVEQEVNLDIDTKAKKSTLTINYRNLQPYNTWLNGINRDYVRVYVPSGAKLLNLKGSEQINFVDEELGKQVFEAFIQIRPQNSITLVFEYELPKEYLDNGKYPLLIQKQPGKKPFKYTVKVNGRERAKFDLSNDVDLKLDI